MCYEILAVQHYYSYLSLCRAKAEKYLDHGGTNSNAHEEDHEEGAAEEEVLVLGAEDLERYFTHSAEDAEPTGDGQVVRSAFKIIIDIVILVRHLW